MMLMPMRGKGMLHGPFIQALGQRLFRYTEMPRPIGQAHSNARESYPACNGSVPILLGLCCPFTVLWKITGSIIDSFDRCASRTWPHITQKGLKSLPAFTDLNSATTIMSKHGIVGIATAIYHAVPTGVFARPSVTGVAMSLVGHPGNFSVVPR